MDPDYTGNDIAGTKGNQAFIDVEAQRNAWLSVGQERSCRLDGRKGPQHGI